MRALGEWKKVRRGWYRRKVGDLWFHVKRVSDQNPHWGWDVFVNQDPSEVVRTQLRFSSCADLGWGFIEADELASKLTS